MRLLQLDSFCLELGNRTVFRDVSAQFEWRTGEPSAIALMGPSGTGKTSLARAIMRHRYLSPIPGLNLGPAEIVIASMPQAPILFPHLDARTNARILLSSGRYTERFDERLFGALVETLRMTAVLTREREVTSLSGGEAQRLMLIRTLSIRPDLLILDEPCTGLDSSVRETFLVDLLNVTREFDVSVLYASHHWSEVAAIAGKVAFLRVPEGEPDNAVRIIDLQDTGDFAKRPPTVEAFESVYGLGTSVWPVIDSGEWYRLATSGEASAASDLVACLAPLNMEAGARSFRQVGPFRLAADYESAAAVTHSGWIYRNGSLEASAVAVRGNAHVQ